MPATGNRIPLARATTTRTLDYQSAGRARCGPAPATPFAPGPALASRRRDGGTGAAALAVSLVSPATWAAVTALFRFGAPPPNDVMPAVGAVMIAAPIVAVALAVVSLGTGCRRRGPARAALAAGMLTLGLLLVTAALPP